MKMQDMNAKTFIGRLTNKLKSKGDVSLKEALRIAEFLRKNKDLNCGSPYYDDIMDWFRIVEQKLPTYGNYVRSILTNDLLYASLEKDIFRQLDRCYDKLSFLDGIRGFVEWFNPNEDFGSEPSFLDRARDVMEWPDFDIEDSNMEDDVRIKVLEYAGEIRSCPELCDRILKMKDVFGRRSYISVKDLTYPEIVQGYCKDSLFQFLVLEMAVSLKCELVYLQHCRMHDVILMHPSDIDRISFLLKHTPDDLVCWIHQNGYIDKEVAQKLFSDKWVYKNIDLDFFNSCSFLKEVCDGFAEFCCERSVYNEGREIAEDDSWADIIR